jgi:hypothetical protein
MKDETPSQIVEAITAIKQARSAPVQECFWKREGYKECPAAQRQWVGLTDEERSECVNTPFVSQQWANIEAKLKEKNSD